MGERIQITTNFYLDEFVDPRTYFKGVNNGFNTMDENIFIIAQKLRDLYGNPIQINNWWSHYSSNKHKMTIDKLIEEIEYLNSKGRINIWSGLRTYKCKIGSRKSAHRFGMAIDPKGDEKKFMKIIRGNAEEFYSLGLRRLEDISITPGWLHMDTLERRTKPNSIRIVDLTTCTDTIWI